MATKVQVVATNGFKLKLFEGADGVALDEADPTKVVFGLDASVIVAAGTNPFTGNQSMGGFKLIDLGSPADPNDATNKAYVDNAVSSGGNDVSAFCAGGPF